MVEPGVTEPGATAACVGDGDPYAPPGVISTCLCTRVMQNFLGVDGDRAWFSLECIHRIGHKIIQHATQHDRVSEDVW